MLIPASISQSLLTSVGTLAVQLLTLPYYRLFHFNTLQPIRRIAACASDPAEIRRLVRLMYLWRTRKLMELQYISIAVRNSDVREASCA